MGPSSIVSTKQLQEQSSYTLTTRILNFNSYQYISEDATRKYKLVQMKQLVMATCLIVFYTFYYLANTFLIPF